MNKMIFAALLCGAAGGAMAQMAPVVAPAVTPVVAPVVAPVVEEVRITRPLARIDLPAERRNVWADEFDQVKGTYYLSNGKTMELSMWGNRMYARIDGMPRSQLVAAAPNVFVALDEQMKITIDEDAIPGRNTAEIILHTPRLAGATHGGPFTRLIASR